MREHLYQLLHMTTQYLDNDYKISQHPIVKNIKRNLNMPGEERILNVSGNEEMVLETQTRNLVFILDRGLVCLTSAFTKSHVR